MLTRKRLLLAVAVVVLIPAAAVAWWLVSPLFISKTVEEEFPFAFNAVVPTDMTMSEVENVMAAMAKVGQEVNEPMSDMTDKMSGAVEPFQIAAEMPTPMTSAAPSPTNTATPMAAANVLGMRTGQRIESDIRSFTLEDLTVEVGVTVAWTNQDAATHTVTAGSPGIPTGKWDSGALAQGAGYNFTFDEVGVFSYLCKIHPDAMQAVVRVVAKLEPTSTPAPAPTATAEPEPTATPTASPTPVPVVVGPVKLKEGSFRDADSAHKGSGQATIYRGPDGSLLLRLEGFNVTNGPELHVLLSPHPNPENRNDVKRPGYVDLGKLKGNRGNQNYQIPDDVDLAAQRSVVIYCKPFHVIFSVASLQDEG
ncbi:MAG: DM13 domain-containing protein [Chloroflexi bacterium]|nr:DM13 domain-containing protein [Chloroflexota bacterium]